MSTFTISNLTEDQIKTLTKARDRIPTTLAALDELIDGQGDANLVLALVHDAFMVSAERVKAVREQILVSQGRKI